MHRVTSWEATQALFEACPDPMWIFDAEDLRFLAVNDAAVTTYGYSREEFLTMTIADIRPQEDVGPLVRMTRRVISGVVNAGRWRHLTKAGETRIVEVRSQRLTWNDREAKMAMIRDVSQEAAQDEEFTCLLQRQRDANLRAERSESHLHAILGAMPGGHVVLDTADLGILGQARGAGKDPTAPVLDRLRQLLARRDPRLEAELRRVADLRSSEVIDLAGPAGGAEDGNALICSCVCDADWVTRFLVLRPVDPAGSDALAALDEGDAAFRWALQAQTLQSRDGALRECSARLRAVQKQMDVGFWTFDLETGVLWWSDEVYRIFGIEPGWGPVTQAQYHALILPEDQDAASRAFQEFLAGATDLLQFEHRVLQSNGETVHVRGTGSRETDGGRRRIIGVVQDISAMRRAESDRNRVQHLMQIAGTAAHFGAWRFDAATNVIEWTPETAAIMDSPDTRFIDRESGLDLYLDDDTRRRGRDMLRRCVEEGRPFDETLHMQTRTGRPIWARLVGEPVRDAQGRITGAHGAFQDVTEQEETRRQSAWLSERLTQTLDQMGDAFYTLDCDWRFTFVNRAAHALLDTRDSELLGRRIWEAFPDTPDTNLQVEYERAVATREPALFEFYDSELKSWFSIRAHPIEDGLLVYFREFTRERAREHDLRLLEAAVAQQTDALLITEAGIEGPDQPRVIYVNPAFERLTGFAPKDVIGRTPRIQQGRLTDRATLARIKAALARGEGAQAEIVNYRKGGGAYWKEMDIQPLRDSTGRLTNWIAVYRDITRRKEAEEALRISEERFRLVTRATTDVIWDLDLVRNTQWWSEGLTSIFGHSRVDEEREPTIWIRNLHPDDEERVVRATEELIAGTADTWTGQYRFRRANGSYATVIDRVFVLRDAEGRATRMLGSLSDVTERLVLEDRLRQAQKLEAVGQLTGGLAHDFNNLLTIVIGNAELLVDSLEDVRQQTMARAILGAAERGAQTTAQLLAFARRQPLVPQPVDLNQVLASARPLIRRAVSERVELEFDPAPELWLAEVDPGQFDNAILNMCLNARDVMPAGGRISISTENAVVTKASGLDCPPGNYVVVSVQDTGHGIDPDILPRIFEPFFTTKPSGKGSGLGLSMVYGFARQSGGQVAVQSAPGQGTKFRLYFPRAADRDDRQQPGEAGVVGQGVGEHILVVEDDPDLRSHAAGLLQAFGYRVSVAAGAQEALDILRRGPEVDLLFTDVVMPGAMNGHDLAERARSLFPGLKVLFTSGYSDGALFDQDRLRPGIQLLEKPYRRGTLARRIHQALAAPKVP